MREAEWLAAVSGASGLLAGAPLSRASALATSWCALLVAFAVFPVTLNAQRRIELAEVHMGVRVRIVLYAADTIQARAAARAAFGRIAQLEDVMSDYRPASEVRRLDQHAGDFVPVSAELFAVLEKALDVARASDGAFDPTVGPIVALWRQARRDRRMPTDAARDSAKRLVGWQLLALDSTRRAARLARAGMRIDLGGIAKGFILQVARDTLFGRGVRQVLIEAGGDIVVGEAPPGRSGWHIETPGADSATETRARALENASIATSGPTEQFVELDGRRYSHVVDPRTALGLTTPQVATVIAGDAALADALATALTVVSEDRRAVLLARFPGVIASVHIPIR